MHLQYLFSRDSLEAAVVQPSGASGQDLAQRQSRNDQLLPNPPNVSWVVNSPTSQRISEPPQRSVHVQETMNMRPDMIGQRITLHSTAGNKDERTTDGNFSHILLLQLIYAQLFRNCRWQFQSICQLVTFYSNLQKESSVLFNFITLSYVS